MTTVISHAGGSQSLYLHHNDLPDGLELGKFVAIDTETMGLVHGRDRLCLVQLSAGDGVCHLVQIQKGEKESAPNLKKLLTDPEVTKIFHFARFDVAALYQHFNVLTEPIYCTKIASKLVRTYTDRHGLKELCKELLGVDISKQEQTSDWGAPSLRDEQLKYAASDVLYLHQLKAILDQRLLREERTDLAKKCFNFLPTRAMIDLMSGEEFDIFHH
ncbi:ribonuclease D [Candidatus Paracaedibacter symbiosus]|uniref:ribonuclease D n=1 Tax=Candidatus Paracaedibacter symbiosus TaxID=244582 RepID=UPI000689D927|nr:ribonuclease H-like domain-containing protein [Candidatus Paracaedibacter symbiosus]